MSYELLIQVACLTPAMGQLLITVEDDSFKIDSLRAVFFVGDLLIKRDVARLRRMAPRAQIINMYGSTETQRSVGYWVVPSDEVRSPCLPLVTRVFIQLTRLRVRRRRCAR
jgi:non-ribosomal peptide synthetase component F